jgi:hypothetical protein
MRVFLCLLFCLPVCLGKLFPQKSVDTVAAPHSRNAGFLVLPVISYAKESSVAFGTAANLTYQVKGDTNIRASYANLYGYYSLKKQYRISLENMVYLPGEKYILRSFISAGRFPDKFWGVGNKTHKNPEESFSLSFYNVYFHLQKKLFPKLFAGLVYNYQKASSVVFIPSQLFDKQIVGKHGYHVSGAGVSISYDSRNKSFWPYRGALYQVITTFYNPALGSKYSFVNYALDARKFIRTFGSQVLALRAYGLFNSGKRIPLRSLGALGGCDNLRGYYEGRFRDKNALSLQLEYRVPVYGRFAVVGFAGVGDVASRMKEIDGRDMKKSFGGGLRYSLSKKERMNIRFDYGFGDAKNRGYYVVFGEAF